MKTISHQFVRSIPDKLDDDVLYISLEFSTAIHTCCCGCGNEVVTPFSPTDWNLIYDGETVSLYPSIGNWSFECKSHYWIKNNKIILAPKWTDDEIRMGREKDKKLKSQFYKKGKKKKDSIFKYF